MYVGELFDCWLGSKYCAMSIEQSMSKSGSGSLILTLRSLIFFLGETSTIGVFVL